MTEGSGLYLAGPQLVKAAIGQETDNESLGGATMHAEISGTVDFKEKDDPAAIKRLRALVGMLGESGAPPTDRPAPADPELPANKLYELVSVDGRKEYDVRDLIKCVVDAGTVEEY